MTHIFDQPLAELLRILCHLGFFSLVPAGVATIFRQTLDWLVVGFFVGMLALAFGGIGLTP